MYVKIGAGYQLPVAGPRNQELITKNNKDHS